MATATEAKTLMGATNYRQVKESQVHSIVNFPTLPDLQEHYSERILNRVEKKLGDTEYLSCDWGDGPDYFRFFPQFEAALLKGAAPVVFSGHCFQKITAMVTDFTDTSVTLTLQAEDPLDFFCTDRFLITTLNHVHYEHMIFRGLYTITFNNFSPIDEADMDSQGVRVFWFCDGVVDLMADILMTAELFLGGFSTHPDWPIIGSHATWYMEESNRQFLKESIGYDMTYRDVHRIHVNKTDIKTGDFLAITRLDGLDEIIMYGSGSHVGHSTVAFWSDIDGEMDLYVLESQGAWYWPRAGIQMNKFDQWIEWADNASFNVVVLQLKEEVRAKFNSTSAYNWFLTVQGLPYGYHNFAYGWLDTPYDNMPPIISADFLVFALNAIDKIIPTQLSSLIGEGLNHRLGTTGLNIEEIAGVAYSRGISLQDVLAMVEVEGWEYSDGLSYVCSSFVLSFYKNAGILDDLVVYGTEFTPRDVYSLSIFDNKASVPLACQVADPTSTLPYCQILGNYRINLGSEYGTIDPYEHMDERCPSIAPNFERPSGC